MRVATTGSATIRCSARESSSQHISTLTCAPASLDLVLPPASCLWLAGDEAQHSPIVGCDAVCAQAADLVRKLCVLDPSKRLGYGKYGLKEMREHKFFKGINWSQLEDIAKRPPVPHIREHSGISATAIARMQVSAPREIPRETAAGQGLLVYERRQRRAHPCAPSCVQKTSLTNGSELLVCSRCCSASPGPPPTRLAAN